MFAYWELLKRFWWAIPLALLAVAATTYRIQRDHARDDATRLEARISLQAEAARQAEAEYRNREKSWQTAAERLVGEKQDTLAAIAADRDSLAVRLRDYARRRDGAVPAVAAGPGGSTPAVGSGGGVSETDAALDDFRTKARICGANERFWIDYATAVGVQAAPK